MLYSHMDNTSIRALFFFKMLLEIIYILKLTEFSVVACKIRVIITIASIGEQLGEMVCGEPGYNSGWSLCNCGNLFGNLGNSDSGHIMASD